MIHNRTNLKFRLHDVIFLNWPISIVFLRLAYEEFTVAIADMLEILMPSVDITRLDRLRNDLLCVEWAVKFYYRLV